MLMARRAPREFRQNFHCRTHDKNESSFDASQNTKTAAAIAVAIKATPNRTP
jgi:hypothetical protein